MHISFKRASKTQKETFIDRVAEHSHKNNTVIPQQSLAQAYLQHMGYGKYGTRRLGIVRNVK